MSTEVALFSGKKLPARLAGREVDATTKALAGGSGASGHRISIKGGVFRMIVDGKQVAENDDRAMNIVILAAAPHVNRQYYEGQYEEGVAASPTCWSADGKTPAATATNIQNKTCDTCPQNISGSGQGESRACRYQQRLAVVLEGDIGGAVYQLALPATSLFGKGEVNSTKLPLQAYARYLAQNGANITDLVTEMKFDTKAATPKLTFKEVRWLDDDEAAITAEQAATPAAKQAITLTVFKQDGGKETAKTEREEEPKKAVMKTKPAAPAAKRPIAEVIADWDEE